MNIREKAEWNIEQNFRHTKGGISKDQYKLGQLVRVLFEPSLQVISRN